jgi:hypothetical protein
MKATEDLMHEHSAVLVALQILDKVAVAIAAKNEQALAHLEQLLDFFKGSSIAAITARRRTSYSPNSCAGE